MHWPTSKTRRLALSVMSLCILNSCKSLPTEKPTVQQCRVDPAVLQPVEPPQDLQAGATVGDALVLKNRALAQLDKANARLLDAAKKCP